MSEAAKITGPDLTAGVPLADLPEGRILAGHADGENIVLCRSGESVYAVSGTCPHYGAPLADGLIVGNTLRCPWHHAAFDLRDGTVASPPALNPLGCWRTEIIEEKIFVRGRLSPRVLASSLAAPGAVVIVGAGAAGLVAAETLRNEGHSGSITLVSSDADLPFDKPNLSKDYLAGNAPEEWIALRDGAFFRDRAIDLRLNTIVSAIDLDGKLLRLERGEPIPFDRLLIATGAEPVRLSFPGSDQPNVHLLRTFADSRAIIDRAKEARRALVIGASFIGLETAAALVTRGLEVHVVAPDAVPLEKVFGQEVGAFVRSLHESNGVVFHLGATVSSIDGDAATLSNGEQLQCDLVVMGVGVRPSTRLAEEAGLLVDKGIVVDEFLQTSAPGVYAAGDAARWRDARTGELRRVEHWVVAQRQGQLAARNILGASLPFESVPFFWSAHYDATISYVGYAPKWDSVQVDGDLAGLNARATYRSAGRVVAVATIFRDRESLEIEAALERGDIDALERLVTAPAEGTLQGAVS